MPITVTLQFETQADLIAFFTSGALPVAAQAEATQVIAKAAKAIQKTAKVEAPKSATGVAATTTTAQVTAEAAPTPTETTKATEPAAASPSKLTLEVVRAKLATIAQGGKNVQVKELIASFGAGKLTDINADQYGDLVTKAEAL